MEILYKIWKSFGVIIACVTLWLAFGVMYMLLILGGDGLSDIEWFMHGIPTGILFSILIIYGMIEIWGENKPRYDSK